MCAPKHPTFNNGDVSIVLKPSIVYMEVTIKGASFRLSEKEAKWLRDFLNAEFPATTA